MNDATEERVSVRKLVFTGHLNVPERKLLLGRAVKASLIRSVIEEILRSGAPFRAGWLPDDSMVGCEIEYRGTASGRRVMGAWGRTAATRRP